MKTKQAIRNSRPPASARPSPARRLDAMKPSADSTNRIQPASWQRNCKIRDISDSGFQIDA